MPNETEQVVNPNIKDNKTISGKEILSLEFIRNNTQGLQIKVKSPIDFSFLAKNNQDTFNFQGVHCFYARNREIQGIYGGFLTEAGYFNYGEYPNLQLLLARGLKDGVIFNFGLVPLHDSAIDPWIQKFKEQVKMIYFGYIKPVHICAKFTSQIVENDISD